MNLREPDRAQVTNRLLITPAGKWVLPGSEEYLEALDDDPGADFDTVLFAVKNLGFISVTIVGAATIEVEIHPRNVDPGAVESLERWLASAREGCFRIRHLDLTWQTETLCSAEAAAKRLRELCDPATPPRARPA